MEKTPRAEYSGASEHTKHRPPIDYRAASDEELMESCAREPDERAFSELMARHKIRAYRFCLCFLHDYDEAQDAAQDSFIRVYRARRSFQPGRQFAPWFHKILRNCALGRLRSARRRRKAGDEELLARQAAGPDADPHKRAEAARLLQDLDRLNEDHREILALRHAEGLSYAEIAERLDIPVGTVMSRLYHAREALRKLHEL